MKMEESRCVEQFRSITKIGMISWVNCFVKILFLTRLVNFHHLCMCENLISNQGIYVDISIVRESYNTIVIIHIFSPI